MQPARRQADERKTKLNRSYQELLDEFSNKDLKTVGNYQLGRLIGKGSFGKVYLASHKLTNGSKACDGDTEHAMARVAGIYLHIYPTHVDGILTDCCLRRIYRSCSSRQRKMTPILPGRYTTTANSYTRTLPGCTRWW